MKRETKVQTKKDAEKQNRLKNIAFRHIEF